MNDSYVDKYIPDSTESMFYSTLIAYQFQPIFPHKPQCMGILLNIPVTDQ